MAEAVDQLTTRVDLKGADLYKAQMEGIAKQIEKTNAAQQKFNSSIAQFAGMAAQQASRAGTVLIGVAVGITGAFGLATKVSLDHERAIERLSKVFGEGAERIVEYAAAVQEQTRFSDTAIIEAAALGATFLGLRGHMEEAIVAAVNMAEATGRDLRTSMLALGKATIGTVGELREMGINVDEVEFKAKGIVAVFEQVARENQNIAFVTEDTSKSIAQLGNQFEDFGKVVGKDVEPVVVAVVDRLTDLVDRFNDLTPRTRRMIELLAGATGLGALFAGLGLKIAGATLSLVSAIIQGGIYVNTLRAEALAAQAAAAANVELAAARGTAAGVAGAGVAGAGISTAIRAGAPIAGLAALGVVAGGAAAFGLDLTGSRGLKGALTRRQRQEEAFARAHPELSADEVFEALAPGRLARHEIVKKGFTGELSRGQVKARLAERAKRFPFEAEDPASRPEVQALIAEAEARKLKISSIDAEQAAELTLAQIRDRAIEKEKQLTAAIKEQEAARRSRISTISAELDVATAFVENLQARGLRGAGLERAQRQLAGARFGAAQRLFQESRQAPSREEQLRLFAGALRTQTQGLAGFNAARAQFTVEVEGVPWKAQASIRGGDEATRRWMVGSRQVQPGHIGQ